MTSAGSPRRRKKHGVAIAVSIAALLGVLGGYSWLAVKSVKLIHRDEGASSLRAVKAIGREQTVFDWSKDACEQRDIPDAPARAYRDARGSVHLLAAHYVNREMKGRTLGSVKHECPVIMRSAYNPNPSKFEDKEWIAAPYTLDGKTIFALIHNEFQGYVHPGLCSSTLFLRCWYNAVTLARSDDLGATFHHARPAPNHLVAEVPYRYKPDAGHYGLFQPSNIVAHDGYYYALTYADPYRRQTSGTCVMRTKHLEDPASWRAWNGDDYSVAFTDPYHAHIDAGDHLCEPVDPDAIARMSNSLTYNTYFKKFILLGESADYDARKHRNVSGFYYSVSDDLVNWTRRKLIRETELVSTYRCGDRDPVAYPSLLDPSSKSRNFETTGRRPFLYFTRLHYKGCQQTFDRDFLLFRIELSNGPAPRAAPSASS
jgi:hypothetical protein